MAIGVLFLWASLYKPVIVAIAGLVMAADALNVWLAADGMPAGRRLWRAAVGPIISGGTAGVGWALVFTYFAAVGRFAEFQEAVFAYNRDYAGSVVQNLLATLLPTGAVVWTAAAYFPLLVVIGIGAAWHRGAPRWRRRAPAAASWSAPGSRSACPAGSTRTTTSCSCRRWRSAPAG